MRLFAALMFCPALATAGVVYEVAIRPVDPSNIALASPPSAAVVTQYFVEDGKVRVGGPNAKTIYLFKDRTMYVVDGISRTVHVLKRATLSQLAEHYADEVKQLQDAAANAPPQDRAEAQRKANDMQEVSERMRQPVPHDYRVTARFESVEGHACRIWEEYERDAKRLELCMASPASLPGGAEILNGLKTLSQFRQGSDFAFGIAFGLADWWPDFAMLGGVPLLIREYKFDSQISEAMLSNMRPGTPAGNRFDLPAGYEMQEGPDYTQWYVR